MKLVQNFDKFFILRLHLLIVLKIFFENVSYQYFILMKNKNWCLDFQICITIYFYLCNSFWISKLCVLSSCKSFSNLVSVFLNSRFVSFIASFSAVIFFCSSWSESARIIDLANFDWSSEDSPLNFSYKNEDYFKDYLNNL